jgi:Glycine zipper 2TM domain
MSMTKFKKSITALSAAAVLATGLAAVPAEAHRRGNYERYERYDRYDRSDYNRYDNRGYYDDRSNYNDRDYYNDRNYRDQCRRDKGTGGTIIGAVVGGLAGRQIAGRGNRTEGVIIGAAVGALAGRAIDKSDSRCR